MNRLARFAGFGSDDAPHEEQEAVVAMEVEPERIDTEAMREAIVAALRTVHDPEIPVNLYDLGLIYRIDVSKRGNVEVDMTLTAPACPVAGMMPLMVRDAVKTVPGVGNVTVDLVWDPPWSAEQMTDEARLQLGML